MKGYLETRYSDEEDEDPSYSLFYIGHSESSNYSEYESFIKDVDFAYAIKTLKDFWDKACRWIYKINRYLIFRESY